MVSDGIYFFYIVILMGYADPWGIKHGVDKKNVRFRPRFPGETAHSIKFYSPLKTSSSDNLVSHDKNGHGNLDIDFSGSLHIH